MASVERRYPIPIDISLAKLWLIKDIAPQAIHYLGFLKNLYKNNQPTQKGKDDYQTEIDVSLGAFLKKTIHERYPNSNFMIEEQVTPEEMANRDFSAYQGFDTLWIIDPLDGTSNYVRGSKDYACSIALAINGLIVLGVIIVPETNEIYGATDNIKNAYYYKNGTPQSPLEVSNVNLLENSTLSLGLSGRKAMRQVTEPLVIKLISNGTISDMRSYGSPVLSSVRVANGTVDAYCCFAYPWDMAAGSIIVKKAGGEITQADGKPWSLFSPNGILSNGKIHQQLINRLNDT